MYDETYGIFKNICSDNHYKSLTKTLNSVKCTRETQKTIRRITKSDIKFAHMGQLIIHDGICYSTFLQNTGDDGEGHSSSTSGVVLAVFSPEKAMSDDFNVDTDIEFYPVGSKGDRCAGFKAASIFKDNSMCLVDNTIYVCFSFITDDNKSHIFCKAFDIVQKKWIKENTVTLRYNSANYDFSDETLNIIYVDKGLKPRAKGLIELVSAWSEYKGEYYATGVTIDGPNNGFIVKTRDFEVMELVDTVPFNDTGTAEIASYAYGSKLFVACRQNYSIPYLYLSFFDLESHTWGNYYKIPDGNSRPWFFEYNNELYLINTVEEIHRRYTNISRIRTIDSQFKAFCDNHPVETLATIKEFGHYFATAAYKGDIYFVCSKDTESFGKLCLEFFDEDAVNAKLLELFE